MTELEKKIAALHREAEDIDTYTGDSGAGCSLREYAAFLQQIASAAGDVLVYIASDAENVELRKRFDLYANVRPAISFPGTRSRYDSVDLITVPQSFIRDYQVHLVPGSGFKQIRAIVECDGAGISEARIAIPELGIDAAALVAFGAQRV